MLRPCAAVPSRSEAGAHSCEGRRILGLWLKDCNSYVCEWLLPFHGCKTTPSCPKIQNSWFLRLKSSWKYGRGMCRRFPEELSPNFFCGWLSTYRSINKPCLKIIRAFWVFLNHPSQHWRQHWRQPWRQWRQFIVYCYSYSHDHSRTQSPFYV